MNNAEPQLGLSSLVEISNLIGFPMGRNSVIRDNQDIELVKSLQKYTSIEIDDQEKAYYFGTLDFLLYKVNNQRLFKFLEFSGTGSGGTSNISNFAFNTIIQEFNNVASYLKDDIPLVLLAFTDSKEVGSSIPRKFVYERFFYADAIKRGLINKFGSAQILTLPDVINQNQFKLDKPTIIIGFLPDFIKYLSSKQKRLHFYNAPVSAILNDTLCHAVDQFFKPDFDPNLLYRINSNYELSANKGLAYKLYNLFMQKNSMDNFEKQAIFELVNTKEDIIEIVYNIISEGKQVVIKPYAGSVGKGIEFFINPMTLSRVKAKVEKAIKDINLFHGSSERAFPYLITDYVDSLTINDNQNLFNGYKYDLRVIVYKDKNQLKAFPSVVRIAAMPFNSNKIEKQMLLSYSSMEDAKITEPKYKYLMPFSNIDTLKMLGIGVNELENLCKFSTEYIKYSLSNY